MTELFGTSGVRGVFNEEVTPELAMGLAKSLAEHLGGSGEVLIGRDTRVSGEVLEDAIISGLLSSGLDVKTLGIVSTPVVGLSVRETGADAGVMITASHNPPEYNGIKLFDSEGMAMTPDREEEIEGIYSESEFMEADWPDIGRAGELDFLEDYLDGMAEELSLENDYRVVIDCASGPSSRTTPQLLERLGCEVVTINSQLDGSFPGRLPEPTEENLADLSEFVRDSDADLGFAHDGDGDRIAAVDGTGRLVPDDKLLALVASHYMERFGGGVVTTVDASKIVDELVSGAGGEVVRTRVGDVAVAQEMDSCGFPFGGEPSGTWILGDVHLCPDGTLAAAKILEMLDSREEDLDGLVDSLPSYPIVREKVDCPEEEKEGKMEEVEDRAESAFEGVEEVSNVDGVRLEFGGGDWILIRPSGTEPYIRITAEAGDGDMAEELAQTAKGLLEG